MEPEAISPDVQEAYSDHNYTSSAHAQIAILAGEENPPSVGEWKAFLW